MTDERPVDAVKKLLYSENQESLIEELYSKLIVNHKNSAKAIVNWLEQHI